ncbi:MAG: hypothetical protein ACP5QR_05000 [Rhizomicrobium sp.]
MNIDLDKLEAIAKAATQEEWRAASSYSSIVGCPVVGQSGRVIADIAFLNHQGDRPKEAFDKYRKECAGNSVHIAAFSPPTALALIAQARELQTLKAAIVEQEYRDKLVKEYLSGRRSGFIDALDAFVAFVRKAREALKETDNE